jgi:dihydroneopterin aldolase
LKKRNITIRDGDWLCGRLRGMEVEVRVGLHPWERHPERPTRLLISVDMWARLDGRADSSGKFIDYDPIRAAIVGLRERPHTDLLETIAEDLVTACFDNPDVEFCRVEILKPDIFNDAEAAGIEIQRARPSTRAMEQQ